MGGGRIFLKNLCDTSFDKDLSNEPSYGRIHLAGHTFKQLLYILNIIPKFYESQLNKLLQIYSRAMSTRYLKMRLVIKQLISSFVLGHWTWTRISKENMLFLL
jgi:hypothetical protein